MEQLLSPWAVTASLGLCEPEWAGAGCGGEDEGEARCTVDVMRAEGESTFDLRENRLLQTGGLGVGVRPSEDERGDVVAGERFLALREAVVWRKR